MNYYNEQLKNLAVQMGRQNKLNMELQELYGRRHVLKEKIRQFQAESKRGMPVAQMAKGNSLAAFFGHVICKTDGEPDQDTAKVYLDAVKYDVAVHELGMIECDIRGTEEELFKLRERNVSYERVLEERKNFLRQADMPQADEVLRIQETIVRIKSGKKELEELILAGQDIFYTLEEFLEVIDDAKKWGMKDLFMGSFLFDTAQYEIFNTGQEKLEGLQVQLGRFWADLKGIDFAWDPSVKENGLLCFADDFLDSIMTDKMVFHTVSESEKYMENFKTMLEAIVQELERKRITMIRLQKEQKEKMKVLILQHEVRE